MKNLTMMAPYLTVFLVGAVISSGYADNGVPSIPPNGLTPGVHRQNNNILPSNVKDPNLNDDTIQYNPIPNTGIPPDAEGLIFQPGTDETPGVPEYKTNDPDANSNNVPDNLEVPNNGLNNVK